MLTNASLASKRIKVGLASLLLLPSLAITVNADEHLKVLGSIKPLALMANDIGMDWQPPLIPDGVNIHNLTLKPSQIARVNEADMVVWLGPELEPHLAALMAKVPANKQVILNAETVSMVDVHGGHEGHDHHEEHDAHAKHEDHDEHDGHDKHEDHDDHAGHDDHHDHDHGSHEEHTDHDDHANHEDHDEHDNHAKHEDHDDHAGHDDHHDHDHGDLHVWTDPIFIENAMLLLGHTIGEHYPAIATSVEAKAEAQAHALHELIENMHKQFDSLPKGKGYLVHHDALQPFEKVMGLQSLGSFTDVNDVKTGARSLANIRELVEHGEAACVLMDAEANRKLVERVAPGITQVDIDILGWAQKPTGQSQVTYFTNLADAFAKCFGMTK